MEKYIIIEDEYEILLKEKDKLKKRESQLAAEKHMATEQTSETRHDNPAFDEVEMQQRMLSKKVLDFSELIDNSKVLVFDVIKSSSADRVSIWKKIELDVDWEEKTYTIWWHQTPFDNRVSYNAPLIKPLMWKEEWDEIQVVIWWISKSVEILSIEIMDKLNIKNK